MSLTLLTIIPLLLLIGWIVVEFRCRTWIRVVAGFAALITVAVMAFLWGGFTEAFKHAEFPGPGSQDFDYVLTGGYMLIRTSADHIEIRPEISDATTPVIWTKVIEVAWNKKFILAKRQQLRVDNTFDFWILDTEPRKLYGPFDEPSFLAKRKELGVPESLILKDVYDYK